MTEDSSVFFRKALKHLIQQLDADLFDGDFVSRLIIGNIQIIIRVVLAVFRYNVADGEEMSIVVDAAINKIKGYIVFSGDFIDGFT